MSKAQDSTYPCGVPEMDTTEFINLPWFDNNDLLEDFLDSIGYPSAENRIMDGNIKYWIPVKFWIYRDDNGNGGPTLQQIQNMMDNLNSLYNQVNNTWIGFYLKCEPTYINNTNRVNMGLFEASVMFTTHNENGCINVHVAGDINGTTVGFAVPGSNSVLIDQSSYAQGPTSFLAHEIGHVFGLAHTHQYSWVFAAKRCFKECVSRTRTWPFSSLCFAPRFKKVCESTGDALKDTPADPNLLTNNSCNYTLGGQDPWDDFYPSTGSEMPETANIMSYNGDDLCVNHFSRLQIAVMLRTIKWRKVDDTHWDDTKYIFDDLEPDNSSEIARTIALNEIQEHNFHQQFEYNGWGPTTTQCDVDWLRFTPTCSGTFTIETSAMPGRTNANTKLTLFNNSLTQLAQNDDISGSNLFSSITYSFTANTTYLIRVENMSSMTTGYYQIGIKYAPVISGSNAICGSDSYSISNLPTGATVTWSVNPTGIVTPNNSTSHPLTLTQVGDGSITLTATVSGCGGTNGVATKTIYVGTPGSIDGVFTDYVMIHCTIIRYKWTVAGATGATNFRWFIRNVTQGGSFTQFANGSNNWATSPLGDGSCDQMEVKIEATNSCNPNNPVVYTFQTDNCIPFVPEDCQYGRSMSVAPNPSSGEVQLTILDDKDTEQFKKEKKIHKIRIINKMGLVKKEITGNQLSKMTINISELPADVYTIMVYDGKQWLTSKLVKQ